MKMKLMVMTLVVAMLLSMSAFAASVGYTSLVPTEINDGADYSITVNYSATGYNTGDQITLLVLTEDDEIIFDTNDATKPTNVAYIDQEAIEGATGSFTFTVAKSFITSNEVYVKLGATAQATAAAGTYTFTTSGGGEEGGDDVEVTVDKTVADSFGTAGLSMISVTPATAIADGKVMTVNGTEMFYTEYNGVKKYITLLANFDPETAVFAIADGTSKKVVFGNVDATDNTEGIDGFDVSAVTLVAIGKTILDQPIDMLTADSTGDGSIDGFDVSEVTLLAIGKQEYPTAAGVVVE